MQFDELSNKVIGCAIKVHRELGPGLLESTYEQCLAHELRQNGIDFIDLYEIGRDRNRTFDQFQCETTQDRNQAIRHITNFFVLFVFFVVTEIIANC